MKKYELTQNSIKFNNRTLYQIVAVKDFTAEFGAMENL